MPIPANLETTCFSNSEITESLIKEYIEDEGFEREDMQEFIETHGEKAFQYDYLDYLHQIEDMGSDVVEAFIEEFSIHDVSSCRVRTWAIIDQVQNLRSKWPVTVAK